MNTLSLQEASSNLPNIIENTIKNSDETVIATDLGAVIMIDENYWEEIQETLRLLKDKKSLAALLDAHCQRDQGMVPQGKSIEEVVRSTAINPRSGIGKPERLKYFDKEVYSRRVNHKDRMVYTIYENQNVIDISSFKGHY